MHRFFQEVLNILNQNNVYHHVSREDVNKTDFEMYDIYSVLLNVPSCSDADNKDKESDDSNLEPYPILQIAYCSNIRKLRIFFDGRCVYNKNEYFYKNQTIGYSANQDTKDIVFDKILDVCIRKSTAMHLSDLKEVKKMLSEQRKVAKNAR